jgi:outer membrane protein assembly factor BamB
MMTKILRLCSGLLLACAMYADWTDWRGPDRDGRSPEKNLPGKWSPSGENLAWKVNIGGRSTPVVLGDHLYMLTTAGAKETLQERLVCLNADTGKLLWERKWNTYHSDVPPHRLAWSAPAVDPETGNVYAYGVGGDLFAFTRDGKLVFTRPLGEEFGIVTTHGGRTVSPIVEGNLLIVSSIAAGWGAQARAGHRFLAFDKKTGATVYVSTPGGRPFDTTYAPPIVAEINGTRMLIAGGGDGAIHAIKVATGEPVWKYVVSKRGVNTGVLVNGNTVYVSHGEENLDTSEMGLLAAIDGSAKGDITKRQIKWAVPGFLAAYSSPVIDGDRIIQMDASANLFAFDVVTGKIIWKQNLGTLQRASAVLADGKIYVGTENGKFFILKPHNDRCEILSEVSFGTGAPENLEKVIASVAVSDGRIFLVTTDNTYAIGKKQKGAAAKMNAPLTAPAGAKTSYVQVLPGELILKPGESVTMRARAYDEHGKFIREEKAEWSLDKLNGTIDAGTFKAAGDNVGQAGIVKAAVAGVTGEARIRVIPNLPMSQNFENVPPNLVPAYWINATGKYQVRQEEGNRVLVKLADNAATKRARTYIGNPTSSNYTVEAEVRATAKRRQMGDAGVVAQRYQLVLFGNNEQLELTSWQPETARSVKIPYTWKAETWYKIKLTVDTLPDGSSRARGKAWAKDDPEPEKWMVERVDPKPYANLMGSPGIFADAPFEVFFDNLKVTPNK